MFDLDSFRENGFIVLKGAISAEKCSFLAESMSVIVSDINEESGKKDVSDHWYLSHRLDNGVLYDIYQRFPVVRPICEDSLILDFVDRYFQCSSYLYVSSFLFKPGDRENKVPWHQDFLSRPNESEKILAWVSLDTANRENGCLEVIPGSHKNGFREWFRVKGETHHDRIKLKNGEEEKKIFVETSPGDVVLFSNFLIHSSAQNSSNLPRRALRFVYKAMDDNALPRGSMLAMTSKVQDFYGAKDVQSSEVTAAALLKRIVKKAFKRSS